MKRQWDIIGSEGLKFFGKMNASISHEIKNVLAIINENAGLLEDLALMAQKDMAIDPERIKTAAGKIQSQVRRADKIVKNLNTFAHSVDEIEGKVEMGELIAFMAALCERLAAMKGLTLAVVPPPRTVTIATKPFFLKNMIWLCLQFAMEMAGSAKTIHLTADTHEEWQQIRFSGLKALRGDGFPVQFPGKQQNALLQLLGGQVILNESEGEILLNLPRDLGEK